jgi:hypothetical protein
MISQTQLTIPRGHKNLPPMVLDLSRVFVAESRIIEIQAVTLTKAPELLAAFTDAYRELSEMIVHVELEHNNACRSADTIKSIIILDKAPEILAKKNLTTKASPGGSADLRQAVLDGDPEYRDALEKMDLIKAVIQLLKDKRNAIEMAFTSVKKILGEQAFNYSAPKLSGGMPENVTAGETIGNSAVQVPSVWGTAKYK